LPFQRISRNCWFPIYFRVVVVMRFSLPAFTSRCCSPGCGFWNQTLQCDHLSSFFVYFAGRPRIINLAICDMLTMCANFTPAAFSLQFLWY
jgi:hypothetical protein